MERELSNVEDNRVRSQSRAQQFCDSEGVCLFAKGKMAGINVKKPGISYRLSLWCLFLCFALSARAADQKNNRASVPQARVDSQPVRIPVIEGNGVRFTHLQASRGLSQVRVTQIIQDEQGFLWFATQVGLNRYDGYKFKVFTHDPERPNSLSGTFVYSLFKDRSGAIWVGSDQFFDKFEPSTESFTHFHIDRGDPIVTHISQDSGGMLWLATETGLYRFDPANGRVSRFGHDPHDPFSLSSDNIESTGEDRSGKFWVVTDAGLDAFDRATAKVKLHVPLPESAHGSLCSIACRSFYEDHRGVFWIIYGSGYASDSGLAIFDRSTNRLTKYSFLEQEPAGVVSTGVNAILEDHAGTMWFGTMGGGLLKYDRTHQRVIRYRRHPNNPDSLAENRIIALFEDREGNIWSSFHATAPDFFADTQSPFEQFRLTSLDPNSPGENLVNAIYQDPGGILWMGAGGSLIGLNRRTSRLTRYNPEGQGISTEILAILEDPSGTMWVGTLGNGLSRFDRKTGRFTTYRRQLADRFSLSNDTVTRLFIDRAGTMWVATWDGLNRFDRKTGRFTVYKRDPSSTEPYFSIVEDQKECLWLGSKSGLVQFCPETGHFTTFQHDPENSTTLSDNSVDSVYEDRSSAIWVGTQDGLNKLDPETSTFTSYFRKDGLPGNAVSCILGDDQGNLWMSTNNGLSRFDPSTRTFKNYSVADGLPGNDLTGWDACFKSRSGEMFFGGFAGAVVFRPDTIFDSAFIPPVVFTDFQLSGRRTEVGAGSPLRRSVTYAHDLTLAHQQASFSLEFSALSFRNPATNRYRYKLDGLDPEWHESESEQRIVNYNALPAGKYVLLVQGATSAGSWSQPAELRISILPPWWATWWFRTASVVIFFGLLWSLYWMRLRQVRHELNASMEARVNERTQIINTVPTLAWSARPDGAAEFFNQRWLDYAGLTSTQAEGWGWKVAIHPDDLDRMVSYWRTAIATGEPVEIEGRLRRFDGEFRWFLFRANAVRDGSGAIVKWYGTNTDIDDRKRAEERVRRSEAFLVEGQGLSRTGTYSWRPDTGEITWSTELYRIFEVEPGTPISLDLTMTRIHPEDIPSVREAESRGLQSLSDYEHSFRILLPDGRIKFVHVVARATRDADGRPEFIGAAQDVTQRHLAEEALSRARSELAHVSRVTTLNALTASITHEINQPLASLVANASICLRRLNAEPPNIDGARETVQRSLRDANRATDVITRLRALFSKKEFRLETLDLNEITREVIALSLNDLQRNEVILRSELAEDLPLVIGDRVQLQQVTLNLLRNASDAMVAVEDRPRQLLITTQREGDDHVRLNVQDSGCGINAEDFERLFEAFHTTKSDGMGIGLAVSRSIIEKHRGRLWAEKNDGQPGTTFSFSIPCSPQKARVVTASAKEVSA